MSVQAACRNDAMWLRQSLTGRRGPLIIALSDEIRSEIDAGCKSPGESVPK